MKMKSNKSLQSNCKGKDNRANTNKSMNANTNADTSKQSSTNSNYDMLIRAQKIKRRFKVFFSLYLKYKTIYNHKNNPDCYK